VPFYTRRAAAGALGFANEWHCAISGPITKETGSVTVDRPSSHKRLMNYGLPRADDWLSGAWHVMIEPDRSSAEDLQASWTGSAKP